MHPIILQMIYYAVFGVIITTLIGFLFKGFFWPYIKVRSSFGRNVMIKIRTPLRDYFKVGWVEEGFLCYKIKVNKGLFDKSNIIRIAIPKNELVFYRCLSVNWVSVDEEKNAICKPDYNTVNGFDSIKFDNLLTRALTRPSIGDKKEVIILFLIIGILGLLAFSLYLNYRNGQALQSLQIIIQNLPNSLKGSITQGTTAITGGG